MSEPEIEITNQHEFPFTVDGYDGYLTRTEWNDTDEVSWDVHVRFGDHHPVWLTYHRDLDQRPTDEVISGLIADFNDTVRAYADALRSLASGETISYNTGWKNSRAQGAWIISRMQADSFHRVITREHDGAIVRAGEHGADDIAFGLACLAADGATVTRL